MHFSPAGMRLFVLVSAIGGAIVPSAALAQGAGSHAGPVNGRPSQIELFPDAPANQRVDPRSDASWAVIANSYRSALAFTECAVKLDPDAMNELIGRPVGHSDEWESMMRIARKYRSCVGEAGAVAPILIRAAVAETSLKGLGRAVARASELRQVGIPEVVEGYPLGRVARCQAHEAPDRVRRLLATRPGSTEERQVAQELFTSVPQCGTGVGLGRVQPTAARIALVEAAFAAR